MFREIFSLNNALFWTVINLKSLGPIDRTMIHEHGKNDGFVLFEYIIIPCSRFLQIYKHPRYEIKIKEKNMSTVNRKYVVLMGTT